MLYSFPHVVFAQTAYDTNRRAEFKTSNLRHNGVRVIYIPYGIEIADTLHAHLDHFDRDVVNNVWKIYTLSDAVRQQYQEHLKVQVDVQALELQRFDALYNQSELGQLPQVREKAQGRRVVLWKVHFPKVINDGNTILMVTPYISEYLAFEKETERYSDLFFVFMPRPRFKEFDDDPNVKYELEALYSILEKTDNVYIDDDDYRNSLVNADCIIVDRSAVMVEAGCVGVPVLYMYNPDFIEPLTEAVKPLIDSYYQGTNCTDMNHFIEMFQRGDDPLKDQRERAFRVCVPYFDGKYGERIKEDIVRSIAMELTEKNQAGLRNKVQHWSSGFQGLRIILFLT